MTELLSPAGSLESLKAAVDAGADAVYIGGKNFSARAYAENPDREGLIEGIKYCHLRGRKCYLTLNTLVKEDELYGALFDFLDPLYLNGLDAVIVQDLGVLTEVRKRYPDLAVHASTQMSLTTPEGAQLLMRHGVSRIIPARELSLREIRAMTKCGIEVETFIHGALCYCYSGRCLFSSMLGGRSGNRGRCAQPCRKKYNGDQFLLSMKDLNTIDLLPDLIDAGIASFKIEGRMKQSVYTAGVTAIYRKYMDLYANAGREGYHVEESDRRLLFDLFNRSGFTEGYYKGNIGRDMLEINRNAQRKKSVPAEKGNSKVKINGDLRISANKPAILVLWCADAPCGPDNGVQAEGEVPQPAKTAALTEDLLQKQIRKTGESAFYFDQLTVTLNEGLFLPVQAINELRRDALSQLQLQILKKEDPRHGRPDLRIESSRKKNVPGQGKEHRPRFTVSVTLPEQLQVLLDALPGPGLDTVYFDSMLLGTQKELPENCRRIREQIAQLHRQNIHCYFIFPPVLREAGQLLLQDQDVSALLSAFDGFSVHTVDELAFLQSMGCEKTIAAEEDLYTFNSAAVDFLQSEGISRMTLPAELTGTEMRHLPMKDRELILYGRAPLMQSAQCLTKTEEGCTHQPKVRYLTDQMQADFPVLNRCLFCTNTIYNSVPLRLLGCMDEISRIAPSYLRLSFTVESAEETARVLDQYLLSSGKAADPEGTRGHFKRGVE